jgi:hypothetical protein
MSPIQSPVSVAVSRAIAEAELRRVEMSQNLRPDQVAALLGRQADDAAASPLAYDQLLALALRAAARPGDLDCPELDALRTPGDPLERSRIAQEVFARYSEGPYRAVLKAAPDWELRRGTRRVGKEPQSLARWLRASAVLALDLWDHPALPVEPAFRGAILACAGALRRRANDLTPRPAAPDRPVADHHRPLAEEA